MLTIHTILCRPGQMDNYAYLIIDNATKLSAVIDPSEAEPVIKKCEELKIKPNWILCTHHHFDHTDGNLELKAKYDCKIKGADERIPGIDIILKDGDVFELGQSKGEIIDVSFHTQNSVLYYFKPHLFTGDTLFNLCVGGLFEGTEEQMEIALDKIKSLPDDTLFYPGHEYTRYGLRDAIRANPDSKDMEEYIKIIEERTKQGLPVHPTPLGLEKKCNPYLR